MIVCMSSLSFHVEMELCVEIAGENVKCSLVVKVLIASNTVVVFYGSNT